MLPRTEQRPRKLDRVLQMWERAQFASGSIEEAFLCTPASHLQVARAPAWILTMMRLDLEKSGNLQSETESEDGA